MAFDAFISYSTSPDYRLAQRVQSFLERFHRLPLTQTEARTPLKIFRDGEGVGYNSSGIKTALATYLAESRYLIVLCSAGAASSSYVEAEVAWFLANRGLLNVAVCVTEGHDPRAEPARYFPPAIVAAGLHEQPYYDLRGYRKADAAHWQKVRDLDEELVRLACQLAGLDIRQVLPLWQREERRRLNRQRNVALGVAVAILVLLVGVVWQTRNLAIAQKDLSVANGSLQTSNAQLTVSNHQLKLDSMHLRAQRDTIQDRNDSLRYANYRIVQANDSARKAQARALANAQLATRRAQLARANALIAAANASLPLNPTRSFLLATEAWRITPTPRCADALVRAYLSGPFCRTYPARFGAVSADGQAYAIIDTSGVLHIRDWQDRPLRSSIPLDNVPTAYRNLRFARDYIVLTRKLLYWSQGRLVGNDIYIRIPIRPNTSEEPIAFPTEPTEQTIPEGLSSDAQLYLTCNGQSALLLHDLRASSTASRTLHTRCQRVLSAWFTPDNRYVIAVGDRPGAEILDARSGRLVDTLAIDQRVNHIVPLASATGAEASCRFGFFADSGYYLYDAGASPRWRLVGQAGAKAVVSPDASAMLLMNFTTHNVEVWPTAGQLNRRYGLEGREQALQAAFGTTDEQVITGEVDFSCRLWRHGTPYGVLRAHTNHLTYVGLGARGEAALTVANDGTARRWWFSHQGPQLQTLLGYSTANVRYNPQSGSYEVKGTGPTSTWQDSGVTPQRLLAQVLVVKEFGEIDTLSTSDTDSSL